MLIELIDSDFDGRFEDSHDCPIARCIKRYFPNIYIEVGCSTIYLGSSVYNAKCFDMRLPSQEIEEYWVGSIAVNQMRLNLIPRLVEIIGLELEDA